MYDLEKFTLKDTTECGAVLRKLGSAAHCMEEVAQGTVKHLYDNLRAGSKKEKACALVRFFITQPYCSLEQPLKEIVTAAQGTPPADGMPCLALLATAGAKSEWNRRQDSKKHRAMALNSGTIGEQYPMVAQLFAQFGAVVATAEQTNASLLVDKQKSYNVFYVADARSEAETIPAQKDFVIPNGIKSVVGFGGVLPSGILFAVTAFSRVAISQQTAHAFKPFALNTKIALLPFDSPEHVFLSPRN